MDPDGRASRRPMTAAIVNRTRRRFRQRALAEWLAGVAPARARGEMTVALVSDREICALNRRFRGIAKVTDVLSFPAGESEKGVGRVFLKYLGTGKSLPTPFLGDVVIAVGRAGRQARDAGHSLEHELRLLALHGLLHLLGYNHEHDEGTMARLERRLRRKGGLGEGLIERTA